MTYSFKHTNEYDENSYTIEQTTYNIESLPDHSKIDEFLNKGKYIIPLNYPHLTHWILVVLEKTNDESIQCYIEDPMSGSNFKDLENEIISWLEKKKWRKSMNRNRNCQELQNQMRNWTLVRPFVYNQKSKFVFKLLQSHSNNGYAKSNMLYL